MATNWLSNNGLVLWWRHNWGRVVVGAHYFLFLLAIIIIICPIMIAIVILTTASNQSALSYLTKCYKNHQLVFFPSFIFGNESANSLKSSSFVFKFWKVFTNKWNPKSVGPTCFFVVVLSKGFILIQSDFSPTHRHEFVTLGV